MDHDKPPFLTDPDRRPTSSPPTDRVIAVIETLARVRKPLSVAGFVTRLELNRSTTTAILGSLEHAGWVKRHADRSYSLGPGMLAIVDAVRETLPSPERAVAEIDALAERVACGASLAIIGNDHLTFVHVTRGYGTLPAGIDTGVRLPLKAPTGASVFAFRDTEMQQRWLESGKKSEKATTENLLVQIRETGVAIFGPGRADPEVLDVLQTAVEMLSEDPDRKSLQQTVFQLLSRIGGRAYTASELDSDQTLPISYMTVPVLNSSSIPEYELQIGPLRDSVSRCERERYVHELTETVSKLSKPN